MGFQLGWLACVLGAAHGSPQLGVLLSLPILAWHFWHAQPAWQEMRLLLLVALSGGAVDQILLNLALVGYPGASAPGGVLPAWMWSLWLLFASTLNVGLRWLRGHPIAAVIFGLVGLLSRCADRRGLVELARPAIDDGVAAQDQRRGFAGKRYRRTPARLCRIHPAHLCLFPVEAREGRYR